MPNRDGTWPQGKGQITGKWTWTCKGWKNTPLTPGQWRWCWNWKWRWCGNWKGRWFWNGYDDSVEETK